jgi:hypothetical protein
LLVFRKTFSSSIDPIEILVAYLSGVGWEGRRVLQQGVPLTPSSLFTLGGR